jgi:predicted Zn-dependent peptidase
MILLPSLMNAQIDRSKAPKPGPAPDVRVGKAHDSTLPNGMKVIVVENHKLPMVSVQVRFDHPPVAQGEIAGYQELVGELLTSGTARRSKEQIDETVDRLGAQLSGSTDGVFASSLKKNFPELLRLVYEVIAAPGFPVAEFEKARTRYLSNIKSRTDDPDQISEVVGRALTYGKRHPYGEVATEASLAKIKRDHLVAYYAHFFQPTKGYIVFVGDITEKEAVQQAKDLFGSWRGATNTSSVDASGLTVVNGLGPVEFAGAPPKALAPRGMNFVDRAGSAQSVIKVVFPVELVPSDPMALPAQVMNTILGGGVFNARLMQNLREARAFTYGAYSNIEADRWCGNFSAGCSVRNDVTDSAVTEIMYEIERMRNEPVTPEELALAKSYMAGSFARSLEDPRTIARFALNIALYGLPDDHYATYLKRLDTISAATIHGAAQRLLLPDNAMVLVVGDKEQVANKLAPLSFTRNVVLYDVNGDIHREQFELPPAGMTADDVLTAYVKALGGVEALGKVRTLRKEYEATVQGMTVSLLEQHSAPNKYAMSLGNGPMVLQKLVFDGVRGKRSGMEGMSELVDEDLEDARQSAYMFPELFYRELDHKALLNGVVEVEGRKCYRLFIQKSSGGAFTDYYDQETHLKIRRVENQTSEEGNFQVTTDYADHKAVNGVLFPHTIHQNAGMQFHFTAKSIEVNKPIDPTVFVVE